MISLKEFVHVDVTHIYYVCQKLSLKEWLKVHKIGEIKKTCENLALFVNSYLGEFSF